MPEILKVLGPRIKVQVDPPKETKSAGGIIMTTDIKSEEDQEIGIVVQLGDYAYGNFKENWCDIGDKVLFQRYAGKPREELGIDGKIKYVRVLKDIDVIGVLETVEGKTDE
jgi:co-chaperonin GroES (HSP10)